jgi:23S rRNA (guanosine2251-2'-O)-methyltransferase
MLWPQIAAMKRDRRHQNKRESGQRAHPAEAGWLAGRHAVEAALSAGRRPVHEVWLVADPGEVRAFQQRFPLVQVQVVGLAELDRRFPGQVHQGIAARVGSLPQPALNDILAAHPKLLVALDQVTDPHNLGAVLRSAAAFGVDAVLTPERHSAHLTPVVAKAAAGALETVPLVTVGNLAQALLKTAEAGLQVVGLAGEGDTEIAAIKPGPVCLVLGSEGEGLRRLTRERCDLLARIPIGPAIESLNVSVAAGIALFALSRR